MNLANLPEQQQEVIRIDRERWFAARKMIEQPRQQVTDWLNGMLEPEREDMRRRLNAIIQRRKEIRGQR